MSTEKFFRNDQRFVPAAVPAIVPAAVPLRGQIQHEYEYPEEDVNYTGRKLTHELQKGPVQQREYKNIKCLITFLIIWSLMIYFSIMSWSGKGYVQDIDVPYDSTNTKCGKGIAIDYPYVYMLSEREYYCVSRCPEKSDIGKPLPCFKCTSVITPFATKRHLTMCMPTKDTDEKYKNLADSANMIDFFQSKYTDIRKGWAIILGSAGLSILFSSFTLILIRYSTKCVVWGMIVITFLSLETVGGVSLLLYYGYRIDYMPLIKEDDPKSLLKKGFGGCVSGVIFVIIVLCMPKKIRQAICILKAAGDFIVEEFQIIFVPFFMSTLIIGIIVYWAVFSAFVFATTAEIVKNIDDPYTAYQTNDKTMAKLDTFLLGLVWTVSFICALTHYVVGTCCSYWYYSHQGCQTKGSILKGFRYGLTTNFGGLVYGSAVLPLVWIIKYALSQYSAARKQLVNLNANIPCFELICCKYCVRWFEKTIKFLDKNAYTIMALTGQDFCLSAHNAFYLFYRNSYRVAFTKSLGQVFQILGFTCIMLSSTTICYFIMISEFYDFEDISFLIMLILFISGFLAQTFMILYGYAVDTILYCLIIDIEQNINEGGPKSVPPILKRYTSESELI